MIVGIGASAGALEPLERFFSLMPPDCGLAFVVVQHLERHHPSVLAELVGRHTRMPVVQADRQTRAQPNRVYIIPPNAVLTLDRDVLRVARPPEAGLRTPIDTFFRSLATHQGERAIGVLLSGAGSDGTAGMRAIKEHGGLTLAQSPETAKYDSMPQSAIAAGLVDFVLSVDEMPERILALARRVAALEQKAVVDLDAQVSAHLGAISDILHRQTGHDFSQYKPATLERRIRRRVQLAQVETVPEYVKLLQNDPAEAEQLHRDLLIGVTHFFRDPETFALLAADVIPQIVERDPDEPIRMWVTGCASGEEAYSLAMLVREHPRVAAARPVQIFATDIDSELLATARLGRYPDKIAEHVSPERLERFFIRDDDGVYQVRKELRDMCTFAEHSLIRDPPFSSLDLISCRNVLIYLGVELQKKLVPLFHYALRPSGFLLLGSSDSLAAHHELFTALNKKERLFRRNETVVRPPLEFPFGLRAKAQKQPPTRRAEGGEPVTPQLFSHAFERMILEEYAPPSAVINEHGEILYLAGRAGRYFQVAAGTPTNNIFDLAHGILRVELRNALARAVARQRKVVRADLAIELDGAVDRVRLTVRPLPGVQPDSGLYAIVLQSVSPAAESESDAEILAALDQPVVEHLENELRTSRATCSPRRRTWRRPTRSSSLPTRSSSPPTRSSSRRTRSSRRRRRSCRRPTTSFAPRCSSSTRRTVTFGTTSPARTS